MLDPISDMLTRIRNAQMAGLKEVLIPASKLKLAIVDILEKNNFIEMAKNEKRGKFNFIRLILKYNKISNTEKNPAITGIKRVSHEGQRIYISKSGIKKVRSGYGISIISTSKGVMTGSDARQAGLGGECICEVW